MRITHLTGQHQIEPELLVPLPRKLRERGGPWDAGGCLGLVFLPFLLFGLYLTYLVAQRIVLVEAGTTTTGQLISVSTGKSSSITYSFEAEGRSWTATDSFLQRHYANSVKPLLVIYLPTHPSVSMVLTRWETPANRVQEIGWFAVLWNAFLVFIVWVVIGPPLRARRLIALGVPVVGRVQSATVAPNQRGELSGVVFYEFVPAEAGVGGKPVTGSTAIQKKPDVRLEQGDPLTVLYDPRNPKRNVAYQFAGYQADLSAQQEASTYFRPNP